MTKPRPRLIGVVIMRKSLSESGRTVPALRPRSEARYRGFATLGTLFVLNEIGMLSIPWRFETCSKP